MEIINFSPKTQLQDEIIYKCRTSLEKGKNRRRELNSIKEWSNIKKLYLKIIKNSFHPVVFKNTKNLQIKTVSEFSFRQFKLQNVLFESMPGWNVNASVYMPKEKGVYPGVVCPTGHSNKTRQSYQNAAQIFAQNGYIAVSFDPPGMSGEHQYMNNHFTNGSIGYLTGAWSNTHFVLDAIRSIDYLQSRTDVDKNSGISVTGVSGGGMTAIYTALLDNRVKFVAPVCCLSSHEKLHFSKLYTSCPEQFAYGLIASGIDYIDLISLLAPLPVHIAGGKNDEVYDYMETMEIYEEAKKIYKLYQQEENLGIFIQEKAGHGYSIGMAVEVLKKMNKFIKKTKTEQELKADVSQIIPAKKLKCYPENKANMYTFNKSIGIELEKIRAQKPNASLPALRKKIRTILNLQDNDDSRYVISPDRYPEKRWRHQLEKLIIHGKEGNHIPCLFYKRIETKVKKKGLVFIDESGKWQGFQRENYLAKTGRFSAKDDSENEPVILSIDVSGFGELAPQPNASDIASWNDIERTLTYLSVAVSHPIMGLRVRDALYAINYLKSRKEVDSKKIIVGGRGIGAIVALHAAFLTGNVHKLVLWDMLHSYKAMTDNFPFTWKQSIIIPNVLKYYDLPELLNYHVISEKTVLINCLDEKRKKLTSAHANQVFKKTNISKTNIFQTKNEKQAVSLFVKCCHDMDNNRKFL